MSESLTETLIRHEVLRLRPYTDSVGKLTIGVARNLDNLGISREEAGNGQNHGGRGHRERYGQGQPGYSGPAIYRESQKNGNSFLMSTRLSSWHDMQLANEQESCHV